LTSPSSSTLFPYTTLFRSRPLVRLVGSVVVRVSACGGRAAPCVRKAATMFRHLDRVEDLHQWLIATHWDGAGQPLLAGKEPARLDRKSTRLNSSHQIISYA